MGHWWAANCLSLRDIWVPLEIIVTAIITHLWELQKQLAQDCIHTASIQQIGGDRDDLIRT